jgi:hypothetical protein
MQSSFLLRASLVAGIVALTSMAVKSEELSESDSASSAALSYQSTQTSECMTLGAARSLHPRSHLYWHGTHHCWDATPPGAHSAHTRPSKPEHEVRPAKPATQFAAATPLPDQGRLDNTRPIAMLTDYLAFDMVLEEWRQMSRGLVTPLVDEALSEFDQRWSQR